VTLLAARACRIIHASSRGEPELIEKTFGETREIALSYAVDHSTISRLTARQAAEV
jgi:hypothetical protein